MKHGAGALILAIVACSATAFAQKPEMNYWQDSQAPPGAIGKMQLQRGGPTPGYFQPVKIVAPYGAKVSLAAHGNFMPAEEAPVSAGMLIGSVYRMRVSNVLEAGDEVFPTVEVVNRLYPPLGQERKFPVIVEITEDDIRHALEGRFVTRVIYLEDPQRALPVELSGGQNWFDAAVGDDPLEVADRFGRPMAILRIGGRLPLDGANPDMQFLHGCPPMLRWQEPKGLIPPREVEPDRSEARVIRDYARNPLTAQVLR